MARQPSKQNQDEVGFEQAMEALEAIIERIESGEIGLEESIREYERGAKLVARARSLLDSAEQRVEELTEQLSRVDQAGSSKVESTTGAPNADDATG